MDMEGNVLVYDLGGGTFDASILSIGEGVYEVKSINGDTRLGGADFDRVIVDYCVQIFRERTGIDFADNPSALMRIRESVERVKVTLSSTRKTTVYVPRIAITDSTPVDFNVELTRTRYNELTHILVNQTIQLTQEAIINANMNEEAIDRILVVGGAARAASISFALRDMFGERVQFGSDRVVALGAASQGAILSGTFAEQLLLDIIPHTLRVQISDRQTSPLILRNTAIPIRKSFMLKTRGDDQRVLLIRILAGESSFSERNFPLTEIQIPCYAQQAETMSIKLDLDVDANMDLVIKVSIENSNISADKTLSLKSPDISALEQTFVSDYRKFLLPTLNIEVKLTTLDQTKCEKIEDLERWLLKPTAELILEDLNKSLKIFSEDYNEESSPTWVIWANKQLKLIKLKIIEWNKILKYLRDHPDEDIKSDKNFSTISNYPIFDKFIYLRKVLIDELEQYFNTELKKITILRIYQLYGE
jgi:molecular chaperone DnaK (HSP70)